MATLVHRYATLKKKVGGNREVTHYEETFGMPREEAQGITPTPAHIRRILAEIEFSLRLSEANEGKFEFALDQALSILENAMEKDGVLTKSACLAAEEALLSLKDEAKSYKLILAGHAHIDMNWMWSWHETVAATLATFRTMINIMEEYPDFCFSQSQASVYEIVERFDPDLADKIKEKIREGRWEITASAWVETDKNMPNTESLVRHIKYTKDYLQKNWGIDPASLEIDFSPDTFGHSANVPEINSFGNVKYYYHCRALDGNQALYRWRAPSGKEVLCYREQYWYNSGITPKIGIGIVDIAKRCAGFKTGLVIYGVGDHGGGPTRRDVERAMEMMTWPIFPTVKFGTLREFFHEAESVREKLPLVDHELNYFAPGCYTTQSRIKMANRSAERALVNAEAMATMARLKAKAPLPKLSLEKPWQSVLFTHFHDILTGSCVQDSREHAMGLYSEAMAAAQSNFTVAMSRLAEQIDTSGIEVRPIDPASQAEGAGAGYGINGFLSTMPRAERGNGLSRIFTIFNPTPVKRAEPVEVTVWDWVGDLRYLTVKDTQGKEIPFQRLDFRLQTYWDHKYFRFLAYVEVEPYGYTTIVLDEKPMESAYPLYYQGEHRTNGNDFKNFILENEHIRAEFDCGTLALVSLREKDSDKEYVKAGEQGGLRFVDTEKASSNAWSIGNYLKVTPVDKTLRVMRNGGPLRQGLYAEYKIASSTVRMNVSLEKNARTLAFSLDVDWHEIGGDTIPVLTYEIPLTDATRFLYDVPAGAILRQPINHDVPGLQYGAGVTQEGDKCVVMINESKYGYRGTHDGKLISTFINSSTSPDPYPERGIHPIRFGVGILPAEKKLLEETATAFNNRLAYQPMTHRKGVLSTEGSLFGLTAESSVVSALLPEENGFTLRLYNLEDREDNVFLTLDTPVKKAYCTDLDGKLLPIKITIDENTLSFPVAPYSLAQITVEVS